MQPSTNLRLRTQLAQGLGQSPPLQRKPRKKCRVSGCNRNFAEASGRTQHENTIHPHLIAQPLPIAIRPPTGAGPLFQNSELESMLSN